MDNASSPLGNEGEARGGPVPRGASSSSSRSYRGPGAQRAHDVAEQPHRPDADHHGDDDGQCQVEPVQPPGDVDDEAADGDGRGRDGVRGGVSERTGGADEVEGHCCGSQALLVETDPEGR